MKFDGKAFATEIENEVTVKVSKMVIKPKIVSVLVGDDPASALYTRLKKAAAERVGIEFEIVKLDKETRFEEIDSRIKEIGAREDVTGVMVQLPLPGVSREDVALILSAIPLSKDVDGLRYPESGVVPPVVKAILSIIEEVDRMKFTIYNSQFTNIWKSKFVVVGASGFVGSALCSELQKREVEAVKVESDTQDPTRTVLEGDIVISCTGKEGVITEDMVRDGAIVIDVGAPKGDMTTEVYQKASISVEVPGGVGPVTIVSLMQNSYDIMDLET